MNTPIRPQPTVPTPGVTLPLVLDWVQFEDADGAPRTPMAKIRFDTIAWEWKQVPLSEAGMLVFFNTAPDTGDKQFTIATIVPNGRACYADPE